MLQCMAVEHQQAGGHMDGALRGQPFECRCCVKNSFGVSGALPPAGWQGSIASKMPLSKANAICATTRVPCHWATSITSCDEHQRKTASCTCVAAALHA